MLGPSLGLPRLHACTRDQKLVERVNLPNDEEWANSSGGARGWRKQPGPLPSNSRSALIPAMAAEGGAPKAAFAGAALQQAATTTMTTSADADADEATVATHDTHASLERVSKLRPCHATEDATNNA